MPKHRPGFDHTIDLKENFIPKSDKIYHLPMNQQKHLDEFLDDNLKKGYIICSKSEQTVPMFFVPKADGKFRPCQDYRYLNQFTNEIHIPYLSFPNSSTKQKELNILPN